MKRLLVACLVLLVSAPVFAGISRIDPGSIDFDAIRDRMREIETAKGTIPQQKGFSMFVDRLDVVGGSASFEVRWSGPGWYSILGGCPIGAGQCTSPNYNYTSLVLPPGGYGILTHVGTPPFPTTTFVTPGGNLTTFSSTIATSQPNNLHGFFVLRFEGDIEETYPVFFTTSFPGVAVAGPGRNYQAIINVPGLDAGNYVASAVQRLLHYTQSPGGPTVGGTTATTTYRYLIGYELFDVNSVIPTANTYGLVALGMILVGAGLLVLQRRRPAFPAA